MERTQRRRAALFASIALMLAAGCSSGDDDSGTNPMMLPGPSTAAGSTAPSVQPPPSSAAGSMAPVGVAGSTALPMGGSAPTVPMAGTGSNVPMAGSGDMMMPPTDPMMGPDPNAPEDYSKYKDPGKGDWQDGTPEQCKMDPSLFMDTGVANYAVFRYGLRCHMKGADSVGMMYSATKTLGGTTAGRAAYMAKDIMKSGPGTGPIQFEDVGTDWIASPSYPNRGASIAHVMGMVAAASPSLDDAALVWRYDTVGAEAINGMIQATEKCAKQVSGVPGDMVGFMKQELFDRMGMKNSSYNTALGIASGWSANLSDMGKLGTLLAHDGWYGGERLLSREWVYRMSHPSFETANTSYGELAWLNHRGNAEGIGGNISTGSNAPEGDPCAPPAFWPSYPHGLSKATDCMATVGTCDQKYDVGVFSAQGLNGQFVVVHPGLDLVIVAKNFSGGDGPLGLWRAIRPGLVAMDPMFKGDEKAFCDAYGNGQYAPDLLVPRHP